MSNKLVSIIIVTCGKKDYLRACLESIVAQTYPGLETIVIDNSLNHKTSREIEQSYPEAKIHISPRNLYYCEALNKGIAMSRGGFILCLNDDVVLEKRFVEEALKGFAVDKRIGMVSGKILRQDALTIDSTGLFLSYWLTAQERGYSAKDRGQFENEGYIFGVNGAVAFYKREMLEDIKEDDEYLDCDFHIFYEDLDVSWRARRKGWQGYYVPKAIAFHVRGGTVRSQEGTGRPFARKYLNDNLHLDLIKNRYLAIIKNESFIGFLYHLPGILLYEALAWGYILFRRPRLIKIFLSGLKYLMRALRKRKLYHLFFSRR